MERTTSFVIFFALAIIAAGVIISIVGRSHDQFGSTCSQGCEGKMNGDIFCANSTTLRTCTLDEDGCLRKSDRACSCATGNGIASCTP